MSSPAIRVEGLGKRYTLGRRVDPYRTLGETVAESVGRWRAALRRGAGRGSAEEFWALRDVSFEVAHGEAIGIVGGNGAGKSTLLKVLSRITSPTTGRARVQGRLGSLLEVGTGFHPDLTGRENVFLNGAILGMRRAEIVARFDEIVAFAEVERFIDTPVKRYSSGMYLRLAFSVAAHLEPDVLVVDEVLAVGDAAFQKKCLGKMGDVTAHGRTVLFVSHNMDAVQRLCPRAVLLEAGRVQAHGATAGVVKQYLNRDDARSNPHNWIDLGSVRHSGSGEARFARVRYFAPGDPDGVARSSAPVTFEFAIDADYAMEVVSLAVTIRHASGLILVNADIITHGRTVQLAAGRNVLQLQISSLHLSAGRYSASLWAGGAAVGEALDHVESALELDIVDDGAGELGETAQYQGIVPCAVTVAFSPAGV